MSNLGYLYGALGVIWGLIALYVYRLYRQQQRLQCEIEALQRLHDRQEEDA